MSASPMPPSVHTPLTRTGTLSRFWFGTWEDGSPLPPGLGLPISVFLMAFVINLALLLPLILVPGLNIRIGLAGGNIWSAAMVLLLAEAAIIGRLSITGAFRSLASELRHVPQGGEIAADRITMPASMGLPLLLIFSQIWVLTCCVGVSSASEVMVRLAISMVPASFMILGAMSLVHLERSHVLTVPPELGLPAWHSDPVLLSNIAGALVLVVLVAVGIPGMVATLLWACWFLFNQAVLARWWNRKIAARMIERGGALYDQPGERR